MSKKETEKLMTIYAMCVRHAASLRKQGENERADSVGRRATSALQAAMKLGE